MSDSEVKKLIAKKLSKAFKETEWDGSSEMEWKNDFWDIFYKSLSEQENKFLDKQPEYIREVVINHLVISDALAQEIAREFIMRGPEKQMYLGDLGYASFQDADW